MNRRAATRVAAALVWASGAHVVKAQRPGARPGVGL